MKLEKLDRSAFKYQAIAEASQILNTGNLKRLKRDCRQQIT